MFVRVAVNIPSEKVFTYSVPEELEDDVLVGKRVLVPFGRRKMTGYILEVADDSEWDDTKDILDTLDRNPLFSERDLLFYRWVSDYYMNPLGKSLKSILPSGIDVESNSWLSLGNEKAEKRLTPTQKKIIEVIGAYSAGLSIKTLKKSINKTDIYSDIKILQGLNLITVEDRMKKPDVKTKMEKCFSLIDDFPLEVKLTEKQRGIVDFLKERGESSLSLLRGTFNHAPSTTRGLERKGIVKSVSREVYRKPTEISSIGINNKTKTLTGDQKTALDHIIQGIFSGTYMPYLLHGVTGSGKTEVYFSAIEEVLKLNGSVIFLVPEISLTPQLLSRIKEKFDDDDIAVLHSGISQSEKYDEWRRIQKGEARIVVGVRSAIFAPVCNLQLIIVDEEHDTSYKQDDRMIYNARDLALVRAKLNSVTVVLGSATPGIQTYHNTQERNFRYLHLPKRIDNKPLPRVDIIDMKEERTVSGSVPIVSGSLKDAIEETLQSGKQSLLFLNRRGYTTFLYCLDCGYIFKCLNCSVSMTHHIDDSTLRCHYCNYTLKAPPICPECRGYRINSYGVGTEKVEGEIKALFPEARVERMDSDTTQKRGSYIRILRGLDRGDIDVLIGTQMITKGHDYPNVTLVGVLSADTSLNIPDFRAAEHTFQILTQVSGRGGRGDTPGRVIVQTFNPHHYAIQRAREHDCLGFYSDEISIRRELRYPPFSRMVNFRISSLQKERAVKCASLAGSIAQQLSCNGNMENKVKIMGPAEAPLAKIKGRYRWHMLLMGENITTLHRLTRDILANIKVRDSTVTVDVDPTNFL